ncbi:conserved hypothetical protein [Candidatus Zixiibacteriota bacterium]|nr:conserved hypothetical protein [candidate division Zixibacteria bacterium]
MYPVLRLKSGKESTVLQRHPWIFSGALVDIPDGIPHGSLVRVADNDGHIIGTGTLSNRTTIAVRVFHFGDAVIDSAWIRERVIQAADLRHSLGFGIDDSTTGYRIIYGESDMLPGLVVDRYNDVLVIQISTKGMDLMRDNIVAILADLLRPAAIVERSDLTVRREEGLDDIISICYGKIEDETIFSEYGRKYVADILKGQKTGFYLDQKDLRLLVGKLSENRNILNLFSYSGGFGIAAMASGAKAVKNIDSSEAALALCQRNADLNGICQDHMTMLCADVFQFLSGDPVEEYDMVIIDPPALIKAKGNFDAGRKAHHFLNRAAMRLVKDGGYFVTSSCSSFFNEDDLSVTLRRASVQNNLRLEFRYSVRQSPDHPISFYFPESYYLKSFICQVRK